MKPLPFQKLAIDQILKAADKSKPTDTPHGLCFTATLQVYKFVMEAALIHELEQRGKTVILVSPRTKEDSK